MANAGDNSEYYGGVNQYQAMTGRFSQAENPTGSIMPPTQNPMVPNEHSTLGKLPISSVPFMDINSCYKSPFTSKKDVLDRLELFVTLDKVVKPETKDKKEPLIDFEDEIEKVVTICDELFQKVYETHSEEFLLTAKLQSFKDRSNRPQLPQSQYAQSQVPAWNRE